MAELRQTRFRYALAVATLFLLAAPGSPMAADRCRTGEKIDLQEVCSRKGQVSLDVPADWDCRITELAAGIVVEAQEGSCSLEFLRSPAVMSAVEAARLYESLYLGENRISESCAAKVGKDLSWCDEVVLGEYHPREGGRVVQALYAVSDGEVLIGMLKCTTKSGDDPDWALAAAIFGSYRKPVIRAHEWRTRGGLLGPLYFFVKIPFNQFQNPD